MTDASSALAGLGSDLAFTISFAIARELLDGANEAGISQDELVAVVLALGVIFAALPRTATSLWRELPSLPWPGRRGATGVAGVGGAGGGDKGAKGDGADGAHAPDPSGVGEFLKLIVDMGKRISVSVCVQLLASNVRSKQPLRSVRIVLLFGVVMYFLFLDAMGNVGARKRAG
tara:strand:- start:178 stop:699 length:522 start_codon:yes stop_codon:yes gene_type:complete